MTQTVLHDIETWKRALTTEARLLLFKHSPICSISAAAHDEWERFRREHPEVPTLLVDVIGDRAVARGLATACGVPHASPQAILFVDGAAAWSASHHAITASALEQAWSGR